MMRGYGDRWTRGDGIAIRAASCTASAQGSVSPQGSGSGRTVTTERAGEAGVEPGVETKDSRDASGGNSSRGGTVEYSRPPGSRGDNSAITAPGLAARTA